MTPRSASIIVALAGLAACSSAGPEEIDFADLRFNMPANWLHKEERVRGAADSIWTPRTNDRKESLTVIRSSLARPIAQADSATLGQLLLSAQTALPHQHASETTPVITQSGLTGLRMDLEYVPPGLSVPYHRVHVVLVDKDHESLIHVLYTAKDPDPHFATLNMVLASIHEKEG